jgi:hypothetical protein
MQASREHGPADVEMLNPQGSTNSTKEKASFSLSDPREVKHVSAGYTHNMQAITACTLYSFCSVSMILVNKSLASR